jgi:hypothetical protein
VLSSGTEFLGERGAERDGLSARLCRAHNKTYPSPAVRPGLISTCRCGQSSRRTTLPWRSGLETAVSSKQLSAKSLGAAGKAAFLIEGLRLGETPQPDRPKRAPLPTAYPVDLRLEALKLAEVFKNMSEQSSHAI